MDLSTVTALILAGGLGTRLRPVVSELPKGLAPVAGRPFLEYVVSWLHRQDISRLVFCLGHKAQEIMDYFGDGRRWDVYISYSVEKEPLGTAGALRLASSHVSSTFLALNGDTYYHDPVAPLVAQHRETGAVLTVAVSAGGPRSASGQLILDNNGCVVRFAEKTSAMEEAWLSAGLYVAEPPVLEAIPADRAVSLEQEVLPTLVAEGAPIYAYPLPHGFLDMGTPEGYARLEQRLSSS